VPAASILEYFHVQLFISHVIDYVAQEEDEESRVD